MSALYKFSVDSDRDIMCLFEQIDIINKHLKTLVNIYTEVSVTNLGIQLLVDPTFDPLRMDLIFPINNRMTV